VTWGFLSAAIIAGMWWSYDVLGWGGYCGDQRAAPSPIQAVTSGFHRRDLRRPPDGNGSRPSALFGVQIRRRLSGLLAAVAVTQLSLGGSAAPCSSTVAAAQSMAGVTGSHEMERHAASSATHESGGSTDHSTCDHSGAAACAMVPCSPVIRTASMALGIVATAHFPVMSFAVVSHQDPRPSPEPPPPRI
jgi:hypothetical protein